MAVGEQASPWIVRDQLHLVQDLHQGSWTFSLVSQTPFDPSSPSRVVSFQSIKLRRCPERGNAPVFHIRTL